MLYVRRHEARFYDKAEWDTATCHLCPHQCAIAPSRSGACGVRSNRDGVLYLDNYAKVARKEIVDSVELPLFHYKPDKPWLLVGMKGCNLRCTFCNTWNFSQIGGVRSLATPVAELVRLAKANECVGISFGVNEPAISHEFVADVFAAAREEKLDTHLATSGAWNEDAFLEILRLTSAVTFGLKGFNEEFLNNECGGQLNFIQLNMDAAIAQRVHTEITYLVIEDHPDWREQLDDFGKWLTERTLKVPTILLRLEKAYSWKGNETSIGACREAQQLLLKHIPFVYYLDPEQGLMDTNCQQCETPLVRRGPTGTIVSDLPDHKCPNCGAKLPFRV